MIGWPFGRVGVLVLAKAIAMSCCVAAQGVEVFCPEGLEPNPDVLFCDDFDDGIPLDRKYLRYDSGGGRFVLAPGEGRQKSRAMMARWDKGIVRAGELVLTVARSAADPTRYPERELEEIHWRFFLRAGSGWRDYSGRLTQATALVSPRWAQSFAAELQRESTTGSLVLGAESGVRPGGTLRTRTFRDRAGLRNVGAAVGRAAVFAAGGENRWVCIETRLRLNEPGVSDGLLSVWVNERMDASRERLNFRDAYEEYGVNTLLFENVWNGGAPGKRVRFLDNLVVARHRIGCGPDLAQPAQRILRPPGRPVLVRPQPSAREDVGKSLLNQRQEAPRVR